MNLRTTQIVVAAVLGLALAGGGFAAGMSVGRGSETAAAKASASASAGAGARFGQGGAGARAGAGGQELLTGRIISINDGSITVEVRQPGAQGASPTTTSQIVLVGSNTRVVKTTETDVKVTDLKANDNVQIVGTADSNGNVSATAIVSGGNALQQLFGGGAGGPGGAGGGGRGASPSPSPTR